MLDPVLLDVERAGEMKQEKGLTGADSRLENLASSFASALQNSATENIRSLPGAFLTFLIYSITLNIDDACM